MSETDSPTLASVLLDPERRPGVVTDFSALVEAEVASKTGVSGLAIKAAFGTIKAFKRTIVPDVVDALLDEFVAALEQFYLESRATGTPIDQFVVTHDTRVADALLGVTDARARRSKHKTLVKAYERLRPQGQKQVAAALPRIGALLKGYGL